MAETNEKLATSLELLRQLQAEGARVFRTSQLPRIHRERLLRHGFLRAALKGWVYSSNPTSTEGDTTPWYASFWEFCARYCDERFGESWLLSPRQSLDLHAEKSTIPDQVVVHSPRAQNNRLELPFGCSLFGLKQAELPPDADREERRGLRLLRPAAALARAPRSYFESNPIEAQSVLGSLKNPDELTRRLLAGGRSSSAGWLAGALRHLGRGDAADDLLAVMKRADYDVREQNPFEPAPATGWDVGSSALSAPSVSAPSAPIVDRLRHLWASARDTVEQTLGAADLEQLALRPSVDAPSHLAAIDEIYRHDAYHSLSIEGYQVTPELVARVAAGDWSPDDDPRDRRDRDALAARGYYQAFQRVRNAAAHGLRADTPQLVRQQHREWYRELFTPHVAVGLVEPALLAGYRQHAVFLRGSRHVPPRWEVLGEAMAALFELVETERAGLVRAILAHWLLGYVHPFPDGNGRVARFAMNVLLATAGYPWTVIRVDRRRSYLEGLERASVDGDLEPFARFVTEELRWSAQLSS